MAHIALYNPLFEGSPSHAWPVIGVSCGSFFRSCLGNLFGDLTERCVRASLQTFSLGGHVQNRCLTHRDVSIWGLRALVATSSTLVSLPHCCALRGRSNYGNGSPSIDQKENHNVLATTTFHSKISNMMVSEFPVLAHGRLMGSTGSEEFSFVVVCWIYFI